MLSKEQIIDLIVNTGAGFGAYYSIEAQDQTLMAKRISPEWKWITGGGNLGITLDDMCFILHDHNGAANHVIGYTGEAVDTTGIGDYSVWGRIQNYPVGWSYTCTLEDQNQRQIQTTRSGDYVPGAHTTSYYADYYFWWLELNLPIFATMAEGRAWQAAVTAYLNDPSETNLAALWGAIHPAENSKYPGKDPDEYGTEWSHPEGYGDEGAAGTYDDTSDSIGLPSDPTYGVSDAGFINIYKVQPGALTALGQDVFPQLSAVTDLVTGLQCVSDMLFNSRLIDYVLGVHVIPCAVPSGSPVSVKVGGRTCSAVGEPVTANYVTVDLGSLNINEYFANFADYAYTDSKIFLPFVGFVPTKPEFWNSGTLNIKYKFNVVDGSFMAYIFATSSKSKLNASLVAQYSGIAAIHLPVTGANYAAAISGLVGGVQHTAEAVQRGDVGGTAQGVMQVAANTQPPIQQSGSMNASGSVLSCRKAFLQIERPDYSFSKGYIHEEGLPSNYYTKIGNSQGFTIAENPVLDGIPCTDAERERIRQALRNGVIIR